MNSKRSQKSLDKSPKGSDHSQDEKKKKMEALKKAKAEKKKKADDEKKKKIESSLYYYSKKPSNFNSQITALLSNLAKRPLLNTAD